MPAVADRSQAPKSGSGPAPARPSAEVVRRATEPAPAPGGAPLLRLTPLRTPPVTPTSPKEREALSRGRGEPLVLPVRTALEKSLGVDLAAVRVYHDPQSAKIVDDMGAHAFALGANVFLGSHERPTDLALMAHEVAHVVQQQGSARVQQSGGGVSDSFEREATQVSSAVTAGERTTVVSRTQPRPQFGLWSWAKDKAKAVAEFAGDVVHAIGDLIGAALEFVKKQATNIPGYHMLALIIGRDPLTQKPVERNAVNLIRAFMGLWPLGETIFQALQKYGIIDKVGAWLDQQIVELKQIVGSIRQGIDKFLDSVGAKDLLNLGGVWDRAKKIFTEPVSRATSFIGGLVSGILDFIRDAVLYPLAGLARGTRGYDLIRAILGKDPVSKEPVPDDAEALIGGFLKLINENEMFENMKKAKAIPRIRAWFKQTWGELLAFVTAVPQKFISAFKALTVTDYILLPSALIKIGRVFLDVVGDFVSWAGKAVWTLLEIIFEVVSPQTLEYIKKTGAALKSILKNPIPFVKNLVAAAKLGFNNFKDHFVDHLKAGLINWLLGALPGVYIPKAFELGEILKFVFSVLGISWANIRAKLVKEIGETAVQAMEIGFDIVVTLVRDGPAAAWDKIKEHIAELKEKVISGIISMVVEAVISKAVPKLVAMFIPGAGFISAILTIYDTIKVFIEKISTIIQVVKGFVDSIVSIANGVIEAAANKVEGIMANLLSLAIAFLAQFAGLGKVADKIMEVINKIRAIIDKALDAVVKWIVTMGKKLFGALKAGAKKLIQWWKKSVPFKGGGESHTLKFAGDGKKGRLSVFTEPEPIEVFVQPFVTVKGTKTQVKRAKDLDADITKLQKQLSDAEEKNDDKKIDDLADKLEKKLKELSDVLAKLLDSSEEEGGPDNPVQIDYPKRRASSYPTMYVGPEVGEGRRIKQDDLRDLQSKSKKAAKAELSAKPNLSSKAAQEAIEKWSGEVTSLTPKGGGKLSGGPIGLHPDYADLGPGKVLVYTEKGSTGGGGKVNKLLKPYGFVPKSEGGEGMDGDHVMERQIGGPDHIKNLWPLPASENRSSGSTIKSLKVKFGKKQKEMSVHDAKEEHKKDLYLLIRSVKEGG